MEYLQNHWISLLFPLIVLVILYVLFNPKNWTKIPTNWVGVLIAFGRISKTEKDGENISIRQEGPVWVPPGNDLRILPKGATTLKMILEKLPSAGPKVIHIQITAKVVVKFTDPIKVLLSVVDMDPLEESMGFIRKAFLNGVQSMNPETLAEKNSSKKLEKEIKEDLDNNRTFNEWGLQIIEVVIEDLNFPPEYMAGIAGIYTAEMKAEAVRREAEGKADSWKIRVGAQ